MITKLIAPNIVNSELQLEQDETFYDIDTTVQMTMAQLVAWVDETQATKLLRADSDGVLLVNTGGGSADTVTPSVASVGTSATVVVTARSNRKTLMVSNNSDESVYLSSVDTVAVATGFILVSGATLTLDSFVGGLYGIASNPSKECRILEVY